MQVLHDRDGFVIVISDVEEPRAFAQAHVQENEWNVEIGVPNEGLLVQSIDDVLAKLSEYGNNNFRVSYGDFNEGEFKKWEQCLRK